MRIINNKVYIKQGETPTFSASFINKLTGAPFLITKDMYNFGVTDLVVQFVVKPNSYTETETFNINRYLVLNDLHRFDDVVIASYNDLGGDPDVWDDNIEPSEQNINRLHRRTDSSDELHYAYYDGSEWVEYDFIINVTFLYSETSIMEAKKYNYEIVVLGGNLIDGEMTNIQHKKPLLDLTEFVVEGSIGD